MSAQETTIQEHGVTLPTLSVIIPSFNRCASLKHTVLSLYEQGYPLSQVEVIVVLDGGSDDSAAMLSGLRPPFRLSVLEQANQGSAVARNRGAAEASGEVLVFMDDDMEAAQSFLGEHARSHAGGEDRVILGYFGCDLQSGGSYFVDQLRGWWAAMFRRMRSEGHRYAYTDLMSGNFSLHKSLFQRVGGFKKELIRHHDYELGFRLLAAGAELQFVETAATIHHERSDLHRTLMGKVAEGMDDVILGRLHPSLKAVLPMRLLRRYLALPSYIMMYLAFNVPALGDRLARLFERMLEPIERMRRYATWMRVLSALLIYWYWRGVAHELRSIRMLNEFLATADPETERQDELILRLEEGVDAAVASLDETRPAAATLFYWDRLIGHIPALAGTERLRGRHLRPLLWNQFRAPLFFALAQVGITGVVELDERLRQLAERSFQSWREPDWRV